MAAVATNGAEQEAARAPTPLPATAAANARPAAILDPQLLMAARRGDSERLKDLLRLNEDAAQVVVEVDRPAAAPPTRAASPLDGVTSNEGDSLLHVVAACGDGDEFLRCAKMIYGNKEGLLVARNNRGDTPLHCAAAAGNAKMVACLVALATAGRSEMEAVKEELLRKRNNGGETALHQAVRAASKACIGQLMSVDPVLACIPREGEGGTSPFYLAISLGELEIARHLFDTSEAQTKTTLSYYSGPDGRNVLHAAVSRGQVLPDLLEWLKGVMVDVKEGGCHIRVLLVEHLTKQRDKQTGSTPLHFAAALGGPPLLAAILGWGTSTATSWLLEAAADTCAAYQPDNEGLYPIHVAASVDDLTAYWVVKALVDQFPDCATLRDGKGRTFLHAAVEKERYWVVRYACRQMPPIFSCILNAQDNNGDTPLHRAIDVGNLRIFRYLIRNQYVRLDVANKQALTPLDLSRMKIAATFYYYLNPRSIIRSSLTLLGAPHGESRRDLFDENISGPKKDKKAQEKLAKDLTSSTQVIGIVSVLVATVTFASAFTLPGGYRADGNIAGTPVLAGSYAFDAFVLADAWAFTCSCVATCCLVFAGVASMDLTRRIDYISSSYGLLLNAVRSLVVAFALGLYLVLAPVARPVAVAICVIMSPPLMFFGNVEAQELCHMACMTYRRRQRPIFSEGMALLGAQLMHYFPFIMIFGVPAIWQIKVHTT